MRPNLDSLTEEISHFLEAEHFVIFRSLSRADENPAMVYWDTDRHPDFKLFLECALKVGVRLVHFHTREFTPAHREEALDQLEDVDLAPNEKRLIERRIQELAIYEGLTCAIELSFDFEGRIYIFEMQTEWYEEWHDILDEIDGSLPDDDPSAYGGGYYSNN